MARVLALDHERCTGCRLCELVCAVRHEGVSNPERSRIKIVKWEWSGLFVPMTCRQCEQATCASICPVKAISRNESSGRVDVNYNLCNGCLACVVACHRGAMRLDAETGRVFKCDLCDGDPQCARFCTTGAIEYTRMSGIDKRTAAVDKSE